MLSQFRVKYLQQMGDLRQLSFVPPDTIQRTLPRVKPRTRKSLDNTSMKRETSEVSTIIFNKNKLLLICLTTIIENKGNLRIYL